MSPKRGENSGAPAERFCLTDEEISLSFSIYFNWGYPDYVREALEWVIRHVPRFSRLDRNKELTYARLNAILAEADSPKVRTAIALDPHTSQSVLNFLSQTRDYELVRRVAENRNTHVATLTRLIRHESTAVRIAVSEHRNTPESILKLLAVDEDADVRYAMAENPNMPESVLKILATDPNPYVASRAERSLVRSTPAEIVTADFSKVARRRVPKANI